MKERQIKAKRKRKPKSYGRIYTPSEGSKNHNWIEGKPNQRRERPFWLGMFEHGLATKIIEIGYRNVKPA